MATGSADPSRCRRTSRTVWLGSPSWSRPRSPRLRRGEDLRRLADEQAALRRVATLVAKERRQRSVRRGRREVAQVLDLPLVEIVPL